MIKLLEAKDLSSGTYSGKFISDLIAKFLIQVFNFNKVNKVYNENYDKIGIDFINSVIETLQISFEVDEKELKKIPREGSFITISNYPLGGIDGLILMKIMSDIRPDFKFLANFIIHKIEPIREFSIAINEIENDKLGKPSFSGIKNALNHIKAGNSLGIFPAGEASTYNSDFNLITDKIWQESLIKFIKNAQVPIVPVFFKGVNTFFYHFLGNIHPLLQAARFRKELFNNKNKQIKIRIGNPIIVSEQNDFEDIAMFGRFLRAKTYALGTTLEVKKFFSPIFIPKIAKVQPIMAPVEAGIVTNEIENSKSEYLLFSSGSFDVICAPYSVIPNVLTEIGRLREITFREVGEGTNKSLDVD
jgi:putative hemolysin